MSNENEFRVVWASLEKDTKRIRLGCCRTGRSEAEATVRRCNKEDKRSKYFIMSESEKISINEYTIVWRMGTDNVIRSSNLIPLKYGAKETAKQMDKGYPAMKHYYIAPGEAMDK